MWPFNYKTKLKLTQYSEILNKDDDIVKVEILKRIIKNNEKGFNNFYILEKLSKDINLEVKYWAIVTLAFLKPKNKSYIESLISYIDDNGVILDSILEEILLSSKNLFFEKLFYLCKNFKIKNIKIYKNIFAKSNLKLSKYIKSFLKLNQSDVTNFVLIIIIEYSRSYQDLSSFLLKINFKTNFDPAIKTLIELALFKLKPIKFKNLNKETIIRLLNSKDHHVVNTILESVCLMGVSSELFIDQLISLNFSQNINLRTKLKEIIKQFFENKPEQMLQAYSNCKDKELFQEIMSYSPKEYIKYLVKENRNLFFQAPFIAEELMIKILNKNFSLLTEFLNDPSDLIKINCLNAIEYDSILSEDNVEWLKNQFNGNNPTIVSLSLEKARILNLLNDSHCNLILQYLTNSDPRIKVSSIRAIPYLNSENKKKTSSILIQLLNHNLDDVRVEASKVLLEIGIYSEHMLELISRSITNTNLNKDETSDKLLVLLAKGLKDPSSKKRMTTIEKIMEIGFKSFSIINEIEPCLYDSDIWVRAKAINYFESLNEFSRPFLPKLYSLINDSDWYVRQSAIKAIRKIQHEEEFNPSVFIKIVLTDLNKHVRKEAMLILLYIKKNSNAHLETTFLEAMKDEDEGIRELASLGLST